MINMEYILEMLNKVWEETMVMLCLTKSLILFEKHLPLILSGSSLCCKPALAWFWRYRHSGRCFWSLHLVRIVICSGVTKNLFIYNLMNL